MRLKTCLALAAALVVASCARVRIDPIKVEPLHITVDVNIKVDRQLDEFFAFEDEAEKGTESPTPQPETKGGNSS